MRRQEGVFAKQTYHRCHRPTQLATRNRAPFTQELPCALVGGCAAHAGLLLLRARTDAAGGCRLAQRSLGHLGKLEGARRQYHGARQERHEKWRRRLPSVAPHWPRSLWIVPTCSMMNARCCTSCLSWTSILASRPSTPAGSSLSCSRAPFMMSGMDDDNGPCTEAPDGADQIKDSRLPASRTSSSCTALGPITCPIHATHLRCTPRLLPAAATGIKHQESPTSLSETRSTVNWLLQTKTSCAFFGPTPGAGSGARLHPSHGNS